MTEDRDLLNDYFSIPAKVVRRAKTVYTFGRRRAVVNKEGGAWVGHFDDQHAVQYVAPTKRELLEDMRSDA